MKPLSKTISAAVSITHAVLPFWKFLEILSTKQTSASSLFSHDFHADVEKKDTALYASVTEGTP